MKPQLIRTDLGEELVVLTHREYLALRARAGEEDAEDEMAGLIAAERLRDLDEGRDVVLPEWFCDAAAKGEGSVLRGLRKSRALSQAQVATKAGITQGYYSDVERGAAIPTLDVLDRISAALDLDPQWLRRLERNRVAAA
ncbi:helix-turn-helix domain-containing protein [Enterovirga sp. CN4-39]|uniref:helix-turn-helix domain-containing protein n=1 Tax=Enterovirga sp. CN4-39 TaxID=3400910 RepID=UPI003C0EFD6C